MEKQKRKALDFISRICPVCGKEFFPGPEWVYKDIDGIYCSWGCKRKNEKALEEDIKKYKYKKVEMLSLDGEVVAEYPCAYDAAAATDYNLNGIRYACLKNRKYKGYIWRYKQDEVPEV